jgi:hypothetical protein
MRACWSVPAILVGLCVLAPSPKEVRALGGARIDAISTNELLDALDSVQARLQRWRVTIDLESWSQRCNDPHHAGLFLPSKDATQAEAVLNNRVAVVRDRDRYWIAQDTLKSAGAQADGAAFNFGDTRAVLAFDGMNYIASMKTAAGEEHYLISLGAEDHRVSTGPLDLYGWWVFGQTREGYADHLRTADGEPRSTTRADGTTEWSFFLRDSQRHTVIHLRANRGNSGEILLTYACMSVYRTPDNSTDDNLRLRYSVEFSDHRESPALGVVIPHAAQCTWIFSSDTPTNHYWTVNRLHVVSIEPEAELASLFHPLPSPIAQVGDSRYRLGYKLGDDVINVDGRRLRTHEPLHGDVGERLEWWIEHGEFSPVWDEEAQRFISEASSP